ncbi:MAG: dienelactone hydrolase family protein [Cyanobacteria bacterium P01_H01_bin.58]
MKTSPHPITTNTIEFSSDTLSIPAYVACPVDSGPWPIVIVLQEVFGVNEHIQAVTNRIAQEGYVGIAPHIYHRQVPGFAVGYSDADLELGRKYKVGTQAHELLSDIQGAIAYGQAHYNTNGSSVGCMGFCFGGHVAYLAATLPGMTATAAFYGAGIVSSTPGGSEPTLSRTPEIKGTLYGFFGLDDPLIPSSDVDAIEAALQQSSVKHRIFRYPQTGHGFFCDQRASYSASAAEDAWKHVKVLFHNALRNSAA